MQVVPALIHRVLHGEPEQQGAGGAKEQSKLRALHVHGTGKQYRDFLYVGDAVSGIMLLIRSSTEQKVQLGTGEATTIAQLARIIKDVHARRTGEALHLTFSPEMHEGDKGRVADMAEVPHGWRPEVSLLEGITRTYDEVTQRTTAPDTPLRTPVEGQASLALVLPITSKNTPFPLDQLVLPEGCTVYIVVDNNDPEYAQREEKWFANKLGRPCKVEMINPAQPIPIYRIYNHVARRALKDGHDFFVLWGMCPETATTQPFQMS